MPCGKRRKSKKEIQIDFMKYIVKALPLVALLIVMACKDGSRKVAAPTIKSERAGEVDSTVYGVCGVGTAMNTLELIADRGDTITYSLEKANEERRVIGGLSVGDSMAVLGDFNKGAYVATKVINLTSLLGRWGSIDNALELCKGGVVKGSIKEPKPYTEWKICNGKLLLSADTFDICFIGVDSLYLKNSSGNIFGFRRLPDGGSSGVNG